MFAVVLAHKERFRQTKPEIRKTMNSTMKIPKLKGKNCWVWTEIKQKNKLTNINSELPGLQPMVPYQGTFQEEPVLGNDEIG